MVTIEKVKNETDVSSTVSGSSYPYGTELRLDKDLIDKLEIGGLVVGSKVQIIALAEVCERTEHSNETVQEKRNELTLRLQLTEIGVKPTTTIVDDLYGKN